MEVEGCHLTPLSPLAALSFNKLCNIPQRLNRADLIIRKTDTDKLRVGTNTFLKLIDIDPSIWKDAYEIVIVKRSGLENCLMLNDRSYDVPRYTTKGYID
jgi:hypothetical protein